LKTLGKKEEKKGKKTPAILIYFLLPDCPGGGAKCFRGVGGVLATPEPGGEAKEGEEKKKERGGRGDGRERKRGAAKWGKGTRGRKKKKGRGQRAGTEIRRKGGEGGKGKGKAEIKRGENKTGKRDKQRRETGRGKRERGKATKERGTERSRLVLPVGEGRRNASGGRGLQDPRKISKGGARFFFFFFCSF